MNTPNGDQPQIPGGAVDLPQLIAQREAQRAFEEQVKKGNVVGIHQSVLGIMQNPNGPGIAAPATMYATCAECYVLVQIDFWEHHQEKKHGGGTDLPVDPDMLPKFDQ